MKKIFALVLLFAAFCFASNDHLITVAKDGSGDYTTVSAALEAIHNLKYQRVEIYIKNGVYNEKIKISQDYVTLRGQSKDSTVIEYSQLRTDWIKHKDLIGPAVVNVYSDDVVLENLTVKNTQPEVGPHAFAVYGTGTRIIIYNCNVLSNGGDTVSLWNYKCGMYYHADCNFRGAVDFVCPRGWCFIKNSHFYELKKTASIWHAGGYKRDQKFVLQNCSFDGVKGFKLGRHHYEAQFYLLNCRFSRNMADTPIYRVTYPDHPEKNRPANWGERDYYYDCSKTGGNYGWFKNNLKSAEGSPRPSEITPLWTFENRWNPESTAGPKIVQYKIHKDFVLLFFNEIITVTGRPVLKSGSGRTFIYNSGAGSDTIRLDSKGPISKKDISGLHITNGQKMIGTTATVKQREVNFEIK